MKTKAIIFLLLIFFIPQKILSDTHYVSKKGSNTPPYTTLETAARVIQDAVFAATDGDTVLVNDGIYNTGGAIAPGETLMNRVMITNSIILKSVNGAKKTKIIGKANGIRGIYAVRNIEINGFTIKKGGALNGGGIYANNTIIINNCIILKCFSGEIGAGAFLNSLGIVSNCIFKQNYAYYNDGSAIYCKTNLTMHNCEIIGNKGETIIACQGGMISDSILKGNKVEYTDIYVYNTIITNCIITKERYGGIRAENSLIIDCIINKCKEHEIRCFNSVIKNCHIIKSQKSAISAIDSIIKNCNIKKNKKGNYLIWLENSTAEYCNISNNILAHKDGGEFQIVAAWNNSVLKNIVISKNKCVVSSNESWKYGALSLFNSSIYNSLIYNNKIGGRYLNPDYTSIDINQGGGICMARGSVYNCVIANNNNYSGIGGGIYCLDKTCDFIGTCEVKTNMVYNSIISFNKAKKDPQVGGSNYKLINCYLAEAPDFVDYKNGDYRLKSSSPCIAAGTNMEWMVGTTDLDGNPMPTNGPINLGVFQE